MSDRLNVYNIVPGDLRLSTFAGAILDLVYDRGEGLPLPSVIGVLRIISASLEVDALELVRKGDDLA